MRKREQEKKDRRFYAWLGSSSLWKRLLLYLAYPFVVIYIVILFLCYGDPMEGDC